MFTSAARAAPRRLLPSQSSLFVNSSRSSARRFLSTAPPTLKSRSWKSSAARWALAAGGIYYYNTSNVFAEEPEAAIQRLDESIHRVQESSQPTIDAMVQEKRQRQAQEAAEERKRQRAAEAAVAADNTVEEEGEEGMGGLEEEADQQGAFNPETGEINWDCPCLGGMAHGPCGEEFKAAFSCFVYSNEEPKGVDCIEKFKGMQDCFRQHPEMYGSELEDDEDEVEEEIHAREAEQASGDASARKEAAHPTEQRRQVEEPYRDTVKTPRESVSKEADQSDEVLARVARVPEQPHRDSSKTTAETTQKAGDEGGDLLPKAAHDASSK